MDAPPRSGSVVVSVVVAVLGVVIGVFGARVAGSAPARERAARLAGGVGLRRPRRGGPVRRRCRELRARRDAASTASVALTLDLMSGAVASGLTPHLALGMAAEFGPPDVANTLTEGLRLGALGASDSEILGELGERHPEVQPLTTVLRSVSESGAPGADRLAQAARQQRDRWRSEATERARRASVWIVFPLVLLVFPAFVLLVLVPQALLAIRAIT